MMPCEDWEYAVDNNTVMFNIDTWCFYDAYPKNSDVEEEYHISFCPFCGSELNSEGCTGGD